MNLSNALNLVTTPTKALVVILAVVETICLTYAKFLTGTNQLWALIASLSVLVIVAVLIVVLAKIEQPQKLASHTLPDSNFVRLGSRVELYRKATEMLHDAKKYVVDTTWSGDVKDFSIKENQERANYLEAQEAVASKGINYRELFVVNERRKERLERAEKLDKKHKNYTLQTISNPTHALSMLDFYRG